MSDTTRRIVAGRYRGCTVEVVAIVANMATVRFPNGSMGTFPLTDLAPVVDLRGKRPGDVDPRALA